MSTLFLFLCTSPACVPPLLTLAHLVFLCYPENSHHQTSYLLPPTLDSLPSPHVFKIFSILPASSFLLIRSAVFNGILEVSEPETLNYYTLSRLILLTLSVFRNPTLTHFPLSGFLASLLCDLTAIISGFVFFLSITCTLVVASSSISLGLSLPEHFCFLLLFA